jgi:hypothetical protein
MLQDFEGFIQLAIPQCKAKIHEDISDSVAIVMQMTPQTQRDQAVMIAVQIANRATFQAIPQF